MFSFETQHLKYLASIGYLLYADEMWSVTAAGRHAIQWEPGKQPAQKTPARLVDSFSGKYTGAELGRTCDRVGAYDAFSLPSKIGNAYVFRSDA